MFQLDIRLKNDTLRIGSFELSEVLLIKDSNYPWVILVPHVEGITEIYQLTESEQTILLQESSFVAQKMHQYFHADKMNIAAIGNMVSQLHLHHVARYETDITWPNPVWGAKPAKPYQQDELKEMAATLTQLFAEKLI